MRSLNVLFLPLLLFTQNAHANAQPSVVQLHHRFISPKTGSSDWIPLGSASIDSEMSATRLERDSSARTSSSGEIQDDGKGWYQVGIEREGNWVLGSTRSCLLESSKPISIQLHMSDQHLTSISISTDDLKCSNTTSKAVHLPSLSRMWDIQIQRPVKISSPSITTPPPASDPTTGLPKQPIPEKSFIQKWWLPILGLALFAVGQFATPPAEQPRRAE